MCVNKAGIFESVLRRCIILFVEYSAGANYVPGEEQCKLSIKNFYFSSRIEFRKYGSVIAGGASHLSHWLAGVNNHVTRAEGLLFEAR